MDQVDRKLFAPLFRGEPRSPEGQICALLGAFEAGATASALADRLLRAGLATGLKAAVTRRVTELLDDLERAARVERIPDGRYRVVRASRAP
jgi:hypothetical protein